MRKRLFIAGSIGWMLVGIAHLVGQFAPQGPDPKFDSLAAGLRDYVFDTWPRFTLLDAFMSWGLLFGTLSLFAGAQNLMLVRLAGGDEAKLRAPALLNLVGLVALIAGSAAYHAAPPLMAYSVVFVVFLLAAFAGPRKPAA